MTSLRQLEANRRNARLSTGPVSEEGKKRSRQNALRHGLTSETVIHSLEDTEDYAAFQIAVASDFDATTAVERELVLRLANVLWRLRRASIIETGLFDIQARPLKRLRHQHSLGSAAAIECGHNDDRVLDPSTASSSATPVSDSFGDITSAFLRLNKWPHCPLDRLNRYETRLWRQAAQLLILLRSLNRQKPWRRSILP